MSRNYDIPTTFSTQDPTRLARELERLATVVEDYIEDARALFRPFYEVRPLVTTGTVSALFDAINRFNPKNDDDVKALLPVPDPANAGHDMVILHKATVNLPVYALGTAKINGAASITLTTSAYITFDGQDYTAVAL